MAQLVKNLPAMRETWVQSLGWEDPLEKGKLLGRTDGEVTGKLKGAFSQGENRAPVRSITPSPGR